jgi:hypothetical protein
MKKLITILGILSSSSLVITSCGDTNGDNVQQLATEYCEWAKKADDKAAKNEADDHTDAIQKQVRSLPESDQDRFEELTVNCNESY